jgi:hypothetical protein
LGPLRVSLSSAAPAAAAAASIQRATPAVADPAALSASAETARLEERRLLYETVDALVQASEFEKARKLLDEEQARTSSDAAPEWRDLEQGYRLMADCLERPSPKHRARGEAFLLVTEAHAISEKLRAACK